MDTGTRREDGFSAIEMIISIVVIGIIYGAFANTFITLNSIIFKSKIITSANQMASNKMQEYENMAYSLLPPGDTSVESEDFSSSLDYILPEPRSGKVFVSAISPTLKLITVKVSYGAGAAINTIEYQTYIQQNGVGR